MAARAGEGGDRVDVDGVGGEEGAADGGGVEGWVEGEGFEGGHCGEMGGRGGGGWLGRWSIWGATAVGVFEVVGSYRVPESLNQPWRIALS